MIRHCLLITLMLLVFVACTPSDADDNATIDPTQTVLQGNVDITSPSSGAIIYAETIFLGGTASDIPDEGFQIQLLAPDDSVVAEATVQPTDGTWAVEVVHNYTGDPTEVNIIAKSVDANNASTYDIESILLSAIDNRPDGTFGEVTSPTDGMSIGGDTLLISGRGSGFFENTFGLILETPDGELITEIPVTLNNPNFVDDMPWEAEIPRNDFVGNAVIRMVYQDMESGDVIELDRVEVVVSTVAG